MKNYLALRLLAAALGLGAATMPLAGQTTVDSVITTNLFEPYAVAVGSDGTFYVTDGGNHRVLKVPAGLTSPTVLAGQTGVAGTNNGVADAAQFNIPQGLVLARGGLVVADSANQLIRFISLNNGTVSNLAGGPGLYGNVNAQGSAARFSYPLGLAADSAGNIYIADSQNNSIRKLDLNNNVTTVASNLYQPAAVAVGDNDDLWITDTRRHCIKRRGTNGIVTLVAGVPNSSGTTDSSMATNARFSNPRGLLWLDGAKSLLIVDSGNHAIRRLYYNTNFNGYSVSTYAGTPGVSGAANGPALSATFNSPVGLAADQFGGGFLVADKANNLVRRINTGAVQPPVADPSIGWVDFVASGGYYFTQLRPVISSTFNNDVIIAVLGELGTSIYYNIGDTPPNPLEDTIPDPGAGVGNTPPPYHDGQFAGSAPPSLTVPQPDITIKAIGTQSGRRSSAIVRARFQFQAANPSIIGDNAASFKVQNATTNAQMWYTWDGSEPTNNPAANTNVFGPVLNGDTISFNLGDTNRTFKIRAFRNGYRPSDVLSKGFSPADFVANTISLGFASGEASSVYVAASGQTFYVPVTLSVLPAQKIYSLQFNVVVTNGTGTPVDGSLVGFQSMLEKPDPNFVDRYLTIPPAMATNGGTAMSTNSTITSNAPPVGFASLLVTNSGINLLGVGWLERYLATNLYDTLQQDLIKYSQAHDTLFLSANGQVILGGYSFKVPTNAAEGSNYKVALGRASATSDGVARDVYIKIPTNGAPAGGSINGTKTITVRTREYIVGDCAPFRWFNAGDFGNGNLLNNDVLQVFQSAVYHVNNPPPGSDFFDVMDSSDGTVNDLYNGNIDQIQNGDRELNVDDVFVTFRRSLDPSLKWYARFWTNGTLQVREVPNSAPAVSAPVASKSKSSSASQPVMTNAPTVVISADDVIGAAGSTVQVPLRVHVTGGLPIRIAMLGVTIEALDGSPVITQNIGLTPAAGLGAPSFQDSRGANNASAAWINNTVSGVSGDSVLATLTVTVPAGANSNAAYRVHIDHFSASENGLALFRKYVRAGVVSCTSRAGSNWGDGISDVWRLRYFGSVNSPLSAAGTDPDHDGATNLAEFQGGTDPLDGASALRISAARSAGGVKLSFPTGAGHTYVIECAPDLSGPWTAISTNAGDGLPREIINATGGNRFYRVRAQ